MGSTLHETDDVKLVASKPKARAAPKRKRKIGIVGSLAASEEEIKDSFALLGPTADGRLTTYTLQKVSRLMPQQYVGCQIHYWPLTVAAVSDKQATVAWQAPRSTLLYT